jgi:glycosyltransferase involved in cell wall biosynthesis
VRRPIHVWQVSNERGYAGTERALNAWVRELRHPFRARGFSRSEGPLPFGKLPCHILHLHRHGEADPGWDALIRQARSAGVARIVETNVFGARDASGLGSSLDHHFFVSAMCLWRYAGWPTDLQPGYFARHSVLYNPLRREDFPRGPLKAAGRRRARRSLGLPEGAFLCGRLGRPDPNKWPAWLPAAFAAAARENSNAQLVLMQAPDFVRAQVRSLGISDKVHFLEASADWKRVRLVYEALDCLAHGSRVGESFGYTLAEAQAFGLAVLVDSTPWADNAQIEVVEHGKTGLIAGRPAAFSAALKRLALDSALRAKLGAAAQASAWRRFEAKALARQLERVYLSLLNDGPAQAQPWVGDFGKSYRRRLAQREDPSPLGDGLWALRSGVKLYWRGWASRALKAMGLKR